MPGRSASGTILCVGNGARGSGGGGSASGRVWGTCSIKGSGKGRLKKVLKP